MTNRPPGLQHSAERDEVQFNPGDIVTRSGDDRHRVLSVDSDWRCMTVECVKPGSSGAWKTGDQEFNLCDRYSYVQTIDGTAEEIAGIIAPPAP